MKNVIADVAREMSGIPLTVEGTIPEWLKGTLVRNGPLDFAIEGKRPKHWFDGLAMLHAFSFDSGKATYSNRFLRTDAYEKVDTQGKLDYPGFAQDPCKSLFKRFFTLFSPHKQVPNANVNVARLAGQYVALTETPLPVRFDLETLQTLGVLDYDDKLPHAHSWESAHPHVEGGAALNYLIEYGKQSHYVVYRIGKTAKRNVVARIPVDEPSYMHSFSVTENYVVLTEYPFVVKPWSFLASGKPFIYNFTWQPKRGTRFIVIDRHTGEVAHTPTTKPFFAFHHANAFEENGALKIDIVCYDDPQIIFDEADYNRPESLHKRHNMRLERFHLGGDNLSSETLLQGPIEFPRINSAYDGRPYRYLYLTDPHDGPGRRALYKFDSETRQTREWAEPERYPGEPVFVPSPHAASEDDGVILVVLHGAPSSLLILDAHTFTPLARAAAPHTIPSGLHGQFFN